jgi:hypothetical protein
VAQATGKIATAAAATPRGGLFIEAKDALRARANIDPRLGNRERVVLNHVLRFINHDQGYAWPGYARLAAELRMTVRSVQEAVTRIVAGGYLVRITTHHNPDGRVGVAFAMIPPDDMTWADLIEGDRIAIGHDAATARPSETELYCQSSEDPPEPRVDTGPLENDHCGGDTCLEVPPPDWDGWVHDFTGDTTYGDRSSSGGVYPNGVDTGSAARTLEDWLTSVVAFPEDIVERCHVAADKGVGGKPLTLLAQKLDTARSQGMTDTDIHLLLQDAASRLCYRGKDVPPLNLQDTPPGKCLSKLLAKVILLLGDEHGIQMPEYPAMKRRAEEAKAKRKSALLTKPNTNPYAEGRGKRDPAAWSRAEDDTLP